MSKQASNVSPENFVEIVFALVCNATQGFADSFEKKYKIDFHKGKFIMIYFYIQLYFCLFALKKKYSNEFLQYIREEVTNGYLDTIESLDTKNIINELYNELKSQLDNIFEISYEELKEDPINKVANLFISNTFENKEHFKDLHTSFNIYKQIATDFQFAFSLNNYNVVL